MQQAMEESGARGHGRACMSTTPPLGGARSYLLDTSILILSLRNDAAIQSAVSDQHRSLPAKCSGAGGLPCRARL